MRKVVYRRHGPPADVLELVEAPDPEPGPGEVRVRLTRMTINPADLLSIEGSYGAEPIALPATPGFGAYGVIDRLGEGVERLSVGQPVLPAGGGLWADTLVVPAKFCTPAPQGADPDQAAMMRANPSTAELMLTEFADLGPGDWVAQNAANSSVGRLVIRFAREKGLKTVNVVRRDVCAMLEGDGADAVVIGGGTDEILAATGGARPKLALDAVGGQATADLAGAVADGGTVVLYGLLSGEDSRMPARDVVFRDVALRGFWLAPWYRTASPERLKALNQMLVTKLMAGELDVPVEAHYPLSRVHEAVAHAARGGRDGKIMLTEG